MREEELQFSVAPRCSDGGVCRPPPPPSGRRDDTDSVFRRLAVRGLRGGDLSFGADGFGVRSVPVTQGRTITIAARLGANHLTGVVWCKRPWYRRRSHHTRSTTLQGVWLSYSGQRFQRLGSRPKPHHREEILGPLG